MSQQNQQQRTSIEIFTDKVLYHRLQAVQDGQSSKIILFPFRKTNKGKINFSIISVSKCKTIQNSQQIQFDKENFISLSRKMQSNNSYCQILQIILQKKLINEFSTKESKQIKIVAPQNILQINQLLKQCVIISLKVPQGYNQNKDCIYRIEGFKFNPQGRVTQGWSYINSGKVVKSIIPTQLDRVKKQMSQNNVFSKQHLKLILQQIQAVNSLKKKSEYKNVKIIQSLEGLGQNFYHSQKFINNPHSLLPVLTFQIQIMCAITRGESWKNQINILPIKSKSKQIIHVCINLSEGIQICENAIQNKIKQLLENKSQQNKTSPLNNLVLTNIPTKIVNPHWFLKTEFKQKFSQYYIKGLYEYYHYGDHNFNDQGWGCAYRSLQSLLSWFRLQNKLNLLSVPTVLQIQNLIDLIDCTSQNKLSNTNSWIGATEVSWVVKKLTGFDCRILHIKDGKDIVQHAQMFRDHLQNVGTPIMYGGDQYAYSIVGINYSWKLGEIMFLILDPHYNGSDKVEKILEKKGVCWRKPQQMFKKGVFYNFCLPIVV